MRPRLPLLLGLCLLLAGPPSAAAHGVGRSQVAVDVATRALAVTPGTGLGIEAFDGWRKALQMPTARGLVVGRTLLFPPGDDVAGAVDAALSLVRG